HHQRRIRRQPAENFHSVLLAIDESMLLDGVAGIPAAHLTALAADGIHDSLFGLGLRGPALLVGGEPQIPTRDHNYGVRHVRIVPCQAPGVQTLDAFLPLFSDKSGWNGLAFLPGGAVLQPTATGYSQDANPQAGAPSGGGNDKIEGNFNVSGKRRSTKSAAIARKSHEARKS